MKHLMIIAASISLLISCNKKKVSIEEECTNPIEENSPPCDLEYEIGYGEAYGQGDSLTPGANYRYHFTGGSNENSPISIAFITKPLGEGTYLIVDTLEAENQVVIHLRFASGYYQSIQSGDYLYIRNSTDSNYWMDVTACDIHFKPMLGSTIVSGLTLAKKVDAF